MSQMGLPLIFAETRGSLLPVIQFIKFDCNVLLVHVDVTAVFAIEKIKFRNFRGEIQILEFSRIYKLTCARGANARRKVLMMMLHTRNALGRAGCLLPLYSNSKLCGSCRATNTPVSQYSTSAKDIFPNSSPLIDEPVEKIHKQMSKLSAGSNKRLKGMEKFSARLQEMDPKANTPKTSLSLVCYLSFSILYTTFFSHYSLCLSSLIRSYKLIGHIIEFAHRGSFEVGFVSSHSTAAVTVSLVCMLHITKDINSKYSPRSTTKLSQYPRFKWSACGMFLSCFYHLTIH